MALFYGQPCPLCGINMNDTDRLFATSHFLGPNSDLYPYSDAVMHLDCYAKWEHRSRFGRLYFEAVRATNHHNPFWGVAYEDDVVLVTTNPDKLVSEVRVMLAETGSGFSIALADWTDWLDGEWVKGCHHEIEYRALADVIPLLQTKLPTAEKLVAEAGMQMDSDSGLQGLVGRISYEFACQTLATRAATKGIACPNCGNFSIDYDYVKIEPISESGPQSHLVCRQCNTEFGP